MFRQIFRQALWIPFALLLVSFAGIISSQRTLVPLENYTVYQFLYEPGNAAKVRTSYLKDITDIYFPWKYYISQFHPQPCLRSFPTPWGERDFHGILLPEKSSCYPLSAVRTNISWDIIWPLARVMDFFPAYDLSYFFLLLAILGSAFVFFRSVLPDDQTATLFAAFFTFSFPVARELQYDGLSQCWPFLLLSLWALRRAMTPGQGLGVGAWIAASAALLGLGILRSTLQGLGLWLLLWGLFSLWCLYELERSRRLLFLSWLLPGGALVLAGGLYWNWESMLVFMERSQRFLTGFQLSFWLAVVRRMAAILFSWANFFSGDLLNGFNTLDLSKSIRPLGARESFSYDGNAFFVQPFVGLLFAFSLVKEWRAGWRESPAVKFFLFAFVIDCVIGISPLYRLLYLRFHQWWMLLSTLWFCALTWRNDHRISWRFAAIYLAVLFSIFQVGAFLMELLRPFLSERVGRQGVLGFEPGVWEARIDRWILRAHGVEIYALLFWFFAFGVWWLSRRGSPRLFLASVCVAGLALNIFHFNYPQERAPFHQLVQVLREHPNPEEAPADFRGPAYMPNLLLLVNRPPGRIYESLSIDDGL